MTHYFNVKTLLQKNIEQIKNIFNLLLTNITEFYSYRDYMICITGSVKFSSNKELDTNKNNVSRLKNLIQKYNPIKIVLIILGIVCFLSLLAVLLISFESGKLRLALIMS